MTGSSVTEWKCGSCFLFWPSSPFSALPSLSLPLAALPPLIKERTKAWQRARGGRAAGVAAGTLEEDRARHKNKKGLREKSGAEEERKMGGGQMGGVGGEREYRGLEGTGGG